MAHVLPSTHAPVCLLSLELKRLLVVFAFCPVEEASSLGAIAHMVMERQPVIAKPGLATLNGLLELEKHVCLRHDSLHRLLCLRWRSTRTPQVVRHWMHNSAEEQPPQVCSFILHSRSLRPASIEEFAQALV